jgi:NADH-quinone oxidoreductase subunit L
MFHLMTHASFKALLFLSAGSVIVGMHHEQDMRKMGGLARRMPLTYIAMLVGALALCAIPPFSGFFSKDLIIEAIQMSTVPGHHVAYVFVILGTFVTALYTFRMFFLVFHGKSRLDSTQLAAVHESPLSILMPLILLMIPSVLSGLIFFKPSLQGWFGHSIELLSGSTTISDFAAQYATPWTFVRDSLFTLPFWLGILGILTAWFAYVWKPTFPAKCADSFSLIYTVLIRKYGIDRLYDQVFGRGSMALGQFLWKIVDDLIIDKICVQGLGLFVRIFASVLRSIQTGYLTHYLFFMVIGVVVMLLAQGK